jgi:hypothetical protein
LGLCSAWQLYENKAYGKILSAGWGPIRADFLTPGYDITFSQSADSYKRRRKADIYQDFRMHRICSDDDIVFFGGKDYQKLFCALTDSNKGRRTVFYNSATVPDVGDCRVERFQTATKTNWQI